MNVRPCGRAFYLSVSFRDSKPGPGGRGERPQCGMKRSDSPISKGVFNRAPRGKENDHCELRGGQAEPQPRVPEGASNQGILNEVGGSFVFSTSTSQPDYFNH